MVCELSSVTGPHKPYSGLIISGNAFLHDVIDRTDMVSVKIKSVRISKLLLLISVIIMCLFNSHKITAYLDLIQIKIKID